MYNFLVTITLIAIICSTTMNAQSFSINSIKASLFYNQEKSISPEKVAGTLSENIIDKNDLSLWNTIIGEGWARGCSQQVFVTVEIIKNQKRVTNCTLKFTAYAGNKKILERKDKIAVFDRSYIAPYLLYNVGCDSIKIVAEISENGKSSKMEKIIPFECGE